MTQPAAETAVGPMVIVAVDQYAAAGQRLVQDPLAFHILPTNVQRIVRLARWRPLRVLLFQLTEYTAQGIWGSVLCRKRAIDDALHAAAAAMEQVVILGAGLDTRAYRMAELATLPVFEVDLPENIAVKRTRVEALFGAVPATVQLVPIDFEKVNMVEVLAQHGYRSEQRTFFVWEAVTQYLTEDAVHRTLAFLSTAAAGSRLFFTYVRQEFIDGSNLYGAAPTYQRFRVKQVVWRFGLAPEQVAGILDRYGWREVEQLGTAEFMDRYLRPSGRTLSVSALERSVCAEKI